MKLPKQRGGDMQRRRNGNDKDLSLGCQKNTTDTAVNKRGSNDTSWCSHDNYIGITTRASVRIGLVVTIVALFGPTYGCDALLISPNFQRRHHRQQHFHSALIGIQYKLQFDQYNMKSITSTTNKAARTTKSYAIPILNNYDYEVLSEDPLVYIVHDVLSPEECQAYIDRALSKQDSMTQSNAPEVSLDISKLWPLPFLSLGAGVPPVIRLYESTSSSPSIDDILTAVAPAIGIALVLSAILAIAVTKIMQEVANASLRTSEAIAFNSEEDVPFIYDLVTRAGNIANNHPWNAFEAPVVTKYTKGAVFSTHNDASPTRGSEWDELGGQRIATAITYLNTCKNGGGTRFDRLNITVQPKQGSSLVFYPANRETLDADDRTRHESVEAIDEKWIVQLFGRVNRVPPPLGIPGESFSK